MPINRKYSNKDLTGMSFTDIHPDEFSNSTIKGSCFYRENMGQDGYVDVFPDGMEGVTFDHCNLDNIKIPAGNDMHDCSNRLIKEQNDLEDWVVDERGEPIEPIGVTEFVRLGISADPIDIPKRKLQTRVTSS